MKHKSYNNRKQSGELLDSILNGSTEYAIIATDLNDIIILWNKGAELIYGYPSEEMVGKQTPVDLHLKNTIDNDILFLAENNFRSSIFDHEMNAVRKDGTTVPVSVTVTPRLNKHKEIIGFLIIARDITNIKIQEVYRDVLLEISYAVNVSPDIDTLCRSVVNVISKLLEIRVMFICLFDYQNDEFNIAAQTGLCSNYCAHSCKYIQEDQVIPPELTDCYLTYTQLTINSGKMENHAIKDFIADRNAEWLENAALIHIPLLSDTALLGIVHIAVPSKQREFFLTETQILSLVANEITSGIQRKRLVEEIKQYADNLEKMVQVRTDQLREKDAQLVQSGKLATLGEMAAGIAHEMNQPLGSINLMAQGLLMAKERNKLSDSLLDEKLSSIVEQVDRINKLISHLRTFARQSIQEKQEVCINNPITDAFKLVGQQLYDRNINVYLELGQDLPLVLAEHNKLEQVFLNLFGNARDALDEFETLVNQLKTETEVSGWVQSWEKKLTVKTYQEYNQVVIEILDTGTGIPSTVIHRIFEPFFTTKEVGKGTGLGLSITYGIVKEFDGTIDVVSEEMKGCKFIIKFPICGK
ncbi:MAG: ATP-binding protein [Clostridia bacterium]|nr:ATP-binding protein [Clostridia bacterium]